MNFFKLKQVCRHIQSLKHNAIRPNSALTLLAHCNLHLCKGSFIQYVLKVFRKTNIFYALIRKRACSYQGVRNVSYFGKFYARIKWMIPNGKSTAQVKVVQVNRKRQKVLKSDKQDKWHRQMAKKPWHFSLPAYFFISGE